MTRRPPLLTPPLMIDRDSFSADPAAEGLGEVDPAGLSNPETNSAGGADHLEAIDLDALERGEDGAGAPPAGGPTLAAEGFLSLEAFQAGLAAALTLGGHVAGLSTLLRAPADSTFPPAAAAIYDTIRDVPALHFLIRPGGVWLQRAAVIGMWAVPVAAGVAQELRARRARPVDDPHRVDPAPNDQAPAESADSPA